MSADKLNVGLAARDLEESPAYSPINCVRIIVGTDQNGNQIVYTAGDPKSGRTLDVENRLIRDPTQGQQVADNILQTIKGYAYKPFSAAGAIIDPAAEIGDGVSVGNVYSVLADIETTFSPLMTASIGAPEDGSIDHEYPYESSEDRIYTQEMAKLRTSLIVEQGRIATILEEIGSVDDDGSIINRLTTVEQTVGGIHAYTQEEIQTISGGEINKWAELNFTPTEIESKVSEYFDRSGAAEDAYKEALADSKTHTDEQIEAIKGEYTSAISQSAKQIQATVAGQESKWDLSELPSNVTISLWGFGKPSSSSSTSNIYRPADHSGEYYLNQSSGRYYYSNGSEWVLQNQKLKLITTNLSTRITQTADGLESVVEDVSELGTRMTAIEQTSTDITLSVYSDNYGKTYFKLSDGMAEISSQEVYLNVDSTHVKGLITADYVKSNIAIVAPTIYAPDYSEYLVFAKNAYDAYYGLELRNNRGDTVFQIYDGDFGNVSLSAKGFNIARVNAERPNRTVYAYGIWDFSNADKVIMPDGTVFE